MVTRGYKNATRDMRKLFNRFLPTPFRDADENANRTHRGVIGSISNLLVTEEQDLINSKQESWLDSANGVFLDKWGDVVGLPRKDDETDKHYRKRIHDYIIAKRGTINAIVDAVKYEFGDDTNIFIYEPWRDIFYLNYSLLNGYHHLQGFYYRYAIIDVHVDENIDMNKLADIIDKYKDAGVMVYYTLVSGMRKDAPIYNIQLETKNLQETIFAEFGNNNYSGYEFNVGAKDHGDLPDSYSVSDLAEKIFSVIHLHVDNNFHIFYSYDKYLVDDKYEPLINAFTPHIRFEMDNPSGYLLYVPGNAIGSVSPEYVALVNRALRYISFSFDYETGTASMYIIGDSDANDDDEVFITNKTDLNSLVPLSGNPIKGLDSYNIIFRAPDAIFLPETNVPQFAASNYMYNNDYYREASSRDNIYADLITGTESYKVDMLAQAFLDSISFKIDTQSGKLIMIKDTAQSDDRYKTIVNNYIQTLDFKVSGDTGILIFITDESLLNSREAFARMIKDALSLLVFTLDPTTGIVTGSLSDTGLGNGGNNRVIQNYAYVAMDFNKWYTYNRMHFDIQDAVIGRYLKFSTHGSPYGFNIESLSIKSDLDKELATKATWVAYPVETTVGSDGQIVNSRISSSDYILDLGDSYTISAISISDSYADNVSRDISISNDGANFTIFSRLNNSQTGVIDLSEYSQVADKGQWIAERLGDVKLSINGKTINGMTNYFEVWNFKMKTWETMLTIDTGMQRTEYLVDNIDLRNYLSQDGWFISRFNPGVDVVSHLLLNYYGFNILAQGTHNIASIKYNVATRRVVDDVVQA